MEETEENKGRVAVWLDVGAIKFIADEWRKMPDDLPELERKMWARVAFRCMTALHKSGVEYEPTWPEPQEKYYLKG